MSGKFILRAQIIGFSALLVMLWLVELLRIPYHFFDESPDFNLHRVLWRTGVIVITWLIVHLSTRRLLKRLHELEEFLLICSWCRKVGHKDQWLTIEEYFDSKFATGTSHGICPACEEKHFAALRDSMSCTAVEKPPKKS